MCVIQYFNTILLLRKRLFFYKKKLCKRILYFISLLIQFLLCSASFHYVNQLRDKCLKAGDGF